MTFISVTKIHFFKQAPIFFHLLITLAFGNVITRDRQTKSADQKIRIKKGCFFILECPLFGE